MLKPSQLPSLPLFEGLTQWGEVRLSPNHRENTISVELKRLGNEEEWKPLFVMIALGGKVAFRLLAEKKDRILAYDPTTNTFSDVTSQAQIRDGTPVRDS